MEPTCARARARVAVGADVGPREIPAAFFFKKNFLVLFWFGFALLRSDSDSALILIFYCDVDVDFDDDFDFDFDFTVF